MFSLLTVLIRKTEFLDLCLTLRAGLPTNLRTLITADMYIFIWEEIAHFSQDILKESIDSLISGTKHIFGNAPARPDFVRSSGASKFRICCKRCQHVSRKVNLRNDIDSLGSRISNDLTDLILRIPESFTVWHTVV